MSWWRRPRRLGLALLLVVLGLVGAAALVLVRPWSAYSPLRMRALFDPRSRVENFRRVDRIFPYRTIAAPGRPFRFARAEQPLPVTYAFEGARRTLAAFLEEVTATGLLVVQGDRIVHERYLNGATEESRFTSWSVAKSFTATLVGVALGEGLVRSLDDPVTAYLPELGGSAYDGVPIRHVLQMSSGVAFEERYDRRSDIDRYFEQVFFLGRGADAVLRDYSRRQPSGERFNYASIDTQVLGALVRRVSGRTLAAYLEEKIWGPLGMERDAFWSIDREGGDGIELAFCCLNAVLRDYAKLGRLYLRHGDWDGRRVLPAAWVVEATAPAAGHLGPAAVSGGLRGYQYHWWIPARADREYFAAGVWGQYVYVSEPDELIVVRTSVDPDFMARYPETLAVFRAIRDHLRAPSPSRARGR
jgi:CubicO group peptidase (beta-lactamase class C family)